MGLFDVFSFKGDFKKVFSPENFALLRALAKEKIIEQVKEKYPGQEKMDNVVNALIDYIKKHMKSDNGIVNWLVDNILIPNIRLIAQAIYDDLKQIVKGL